MTSAEFRGGVTAVPLTSLLLQLEVQAPDGEAAKSRAGALADEFLDFRGEQLEKQADAVIEGYQNRIATMQEQMETPDLRSTKTLCVGTAWSRAKRRRVRPSARASWGRCRCCSRRSRTPP